MCLVIFSVHMYTAKRKEKQRHKQGRTTGRESSYWLEFWQLHNAAEVSFTQETPNFKMALDGKSLNVKLHNTT